MARGNQKKKKNHAKRKPETSLVTNFSAPARNMSKADLGAVIFGCKHSTISECLHKQLFGLPAPHYSYIKNITKGLVLFLFNYSDRKLHGIFEAVSPGQLNINRYAWVSDGDGTEYTPFPAQVRIRVRKQCVPLSEDQFGPIILNNYYENALFYFELDHDQTNKLISMFSLSPVKATSSSQNLEKGNNLFRSLPMTGKRQEDNGIPNWEIEAGFDHADPTNETESSWPAVGVDLLVENSNKTSKPSYASIVGNVSTTSTTTSTTPSLPAGKWRALFKPQSASEATTEDEMPKTQTLSGSFSAADLCTAMQQSLWAANCPDGQSSHISEAQMDKVIGRNFGGGFDELLLNQTYVDKADVMQVKTWEQSQFMGNITNNAEHVQLCEPGSSVHNSHHLASLPPSDTKSHAGVANSIYSNSNGEPVDDNLDFNLSFSSTKTNVEVKQENDIPSEEYMVSYVKCSDVESLFVELMQEVQLLRESQLNQIAKTNSLEQELVESILEIQELRNRLSILETGLVCTIDDADDQQPNESQSKFHDSVLIVGGYDGSSWLTTLEAYFPSHDAKISLSPMTSLRKYATAALFNDELYHFGGVGSNTVESFSPANNQWVPRPSLYWKNGRVAGASLKDRLFAVGGGNAFQCSSEVQFLDPNIGEWMPAQSMQCKRLAPAVAELNSALYVVGGYDGSSYLSSVERFDPREGAWSEVKSMKTRKGCHSLVVLNEKLYTLGGYDGESFLPTMEVFDPRMDSWMAGEPLNVSRGSFGAFVLREKIYVIGGSKERNEVLDTIECYNEGCGWEVTDIITVGKRSHFSAIVLSSS